MRSLSSTLLAAQKQASSIPYVKLEACNKVAEVVRLQWTRLYTGSEDDYFHGVAMPGDGSLVRARITLPADSRKLYRQRVANPGPASDFSQWVYTSEYGAVVVACAALGAEASIFWIKNTRAIYQLKSTDYGATWGSPQLLGYSPTTAINGIAAAYKPNGDIALFFADQATLYVIKRTAGSWGSAVAWDKTTGNLSGVACTYDGDWDLVVTGKDSGGDFKLWSLIYGDGGTVAAGNWSALKEFASAPSDGGFEYLRPFLAKPDVYRAFFVEKFTGTESYNRPFWSHSVGDAFSDNLWREPVPFSASTGYGLAVTYYGGYCWLSNAAGVWRAPLAAQSVDVTAAVLYLKEELAEGQGRLTAELRNDDGRYSSPGEGSLSVLDIGCQLDFSPGYRTSAGDESSPGQSFILDGYEHISSAGEAALVLHALDGWSLLSVWRARHQFRWNKQTDEMSVKQLLEFVMARAGLKLVATSQSSVVTDYYPDFTINPGDRGEAIISKLLSFVPDVLLVEGDTAYLVNPLSSDSSAYSYGGAHPILEGRYKKGAWGLNRVQVEGYDPGAGVTIITDSFAWAEIDRLDDRLHQVYDKNIDTVSAAKDRGGAYLREAEIGSAGGMVWVPVNCGQQLYDVIDITDSRAGLNAGKRRMAGLGITYSLRRGQYKQQLLLGAV
ncbi:MAG: hypothetical protein HY530_00885 [Chloroflexi bacterium]|nr:hypothetical protein [Chloroflexota bacterium]